EDRFMLPRRQPVLIPLRRATFVFGIRPVVPTDRITGHAVLPTTPALLLALRRATFLVWGDAISHDHHLGGGSRKWKNARRRQTNLDNMALRMVPCARRKEPGCDPIAQAIR